MNCLQVFLLAGALLPERCRDGTQNGRSGGDNVTQTAAPNPSVTREDAVRISREDAEKKYRDLSIYEIRTDLKSDGWHVDFEIKNKTLDGGGPHYVIDKTTGRILSRRYEQ